MIAHLRADTIRLRHRRDVWIVGFAVLVLFSFSFLASYQGLLTSEAANRDQIASEQQQWALDNPGQDVPAELSAFWQSRTDEIAARRAQYAFPASVMTMLDGATAPLAAVGYLATMTLGLEFSWATIRTVLLSSPRREQLILSRLLALAVYGIALMVGLFALSAILPLALPVMGSAPPASATVEPVMVLGRLGAVGVAMCFVLGLMALLAVVTRNAAMPILVVLILFVIEGVIGNLPIWRSAHLELLAGVTPVNSVIALVTRASEPSAYGLGALPDPSAFARPLTVAFAIAAGWAIAFVGMAMAFLRRADISE